MTIEIPEGYEALGLALGEAVAQASHGKGAERHAGAGEKFSDQLIMSIPKRLGPGGECFCLGQAAKKIFESRRLPPERARAEILGAINYLAAAWCLLGGFADAFGPESDAPRAKEELFERIRDVNPAVYGPARDEALRFERGEPVEWLEKDASEWRRGRFWDVEDGMLVVQTGAGGRVRVSPESVRKA